jgi:uncharacterized protein GlcG (DUF336 family)
MKPILAKMAVAMFSAFLLFAAAPTPAIAQEGPAPYGAPITLQQAERVMDAALAEARANNWNVAIAVVDGGGHLVAFKRMDSVGTVIVDIAIGKARTSAALRAPSTNGQGWLQNAPSTMPLTPFQGALPIVVDGRVIGAIGVSGVESEHDEQISAAGIAALQR